MILQQDRLSQLLADFAEFVRARVYQPQTQDELADCARMYFGSGRGAIVREEMPKGLGFDLPEELNDRARAWTHAALERQAFNVEMARWLLGFDEVPFLGNGALADELIAWRRKDQLPRAQLIQRSDPVPSPELAGVLSRMRPRSLSANLRWTEDEYQKIVIDTAFERLESVIKGLSEQSGCSTEDACRWILAGVAPTRTALGVRVTKSFSGPDHVEMQINPEVATPEDVRLAYRRAIRSLQFPSRGARLAHFHSSYWAGGRVEDPTLDDLYDLWNDVHPLWRFKNVESFRVSRLNAIKRYRPGDEIRKLKRRSREASARSG